MDTYGRASVRVGAGQGGYAQAAPTTPTSAATSYYPRGGSYLPSLQRCVTSLDMSTRLLKSSVSLLGEATSEFARLKTITAHTKHYELVSENDIAEVRSTVAKEALPHLYQLTQKAEDLFLEFEDKEASLTNQIELEENLARQRNERQNAVKAGQSNTRRLRYLAKRKQDLSHSVQELDDALEQKRQEFAQLMERRQMEELQRQQGKDVQRPKKRSRPNPMAQMANTEESKQQELSRREQELQSLVRRVQEINQMITQNQNQHNNTAPSSASSTTRTPTETRQQQQTETQDSRPILAAHSKYAQQATAVAAAMDSGLSVRPEDRNKIELQLLTLVKDYGQGLQAAQAQASQQFETLDNELTAKLGVMRTLCKLLFPTDNVGQTIAKILEGLLHQPQNECYYQDLVDSEFKPEEEMRHNFTKALAALKSVNVAEVVSEGTEDGRGEQLILRIKFEE